MYSDCEDIVVENSKAILARRKKEDELCRKMQDLLQGFDQYMQDKENASSKIDNKEVDELVKNICQSRPGDQEAYSRSITGFSRGEAVLVKEDCFRVFRADSLSLRQFPRVALAECESCRAVSELGSWREVLGHLEVFAQKTYMHACPVTAAFPRYLFFLMSVCDDEVAVRRSYRALSSCWFESPLTVDDILTVFYNWGLKKSLMKCDFEPAAELQGLKMEVKDESASKVEASAPGEKAVKYEFDFPVYFLAVNNTLRFVLNRLSELDVVSRGEDKALALLRTLAVASTDRSVGHSAHILRSLVYRMLDCLNIHDWSEERYHKLITTLHVREFDASSQYGCVRMLVDRPMRPDRSPLKGCVAWAILQTLHGVPPDQVVYVTQLLPEHLSALPPGPTPYAQLEPGQVYLSLQMLADCVTAVPAAHTEDPAFYAGLLRHLCWLQQQQLPRMSVLDSNTVKTLIGHLDFLWKSVMNDLLERQGRPNSLMSYMREIVEG